MQKIYQIPSYKKQNSGYFKYFGRNLCDDIIKTLPMTVT